MNLDHFLTLYTKRNPKWMKDLNVRQEAIKMLEETAGKNLFDLGRSNFLANMSPEAREIKAKMNYWDFIKIRSSVTDSWVTRLFRIVSLVCLEVSFLSPGCLSSLSSCL